MADARALLRAHRAENRIKHPHAAYSDAGKLLCKLCHDPIKTESLWESHLRSQGHRQRLQALQQAQQTQDDTTQKRKRSDDADEDMSAADDNADAAPKKRNKIEAVKNDAEKVREMTQTPPAPGLVRRTSGTPIQGVEIAIPSRPATPLAGSNSAVSTPKITSMTRSPLVGSDVSTKSRGATSTPISTELLAVPTASKPSSAPAAKTDPSDAIIDAEWAAFEAEMEAEGAHTNTTALPGIRGTYADATISAPALTAAEVAAKSQEEDNERRKHAADAQMADDREDASRALEDEFVEMEELESRVRRLKERREELRKGSVMNLRAAAEKNGDAGKENNANGDLVEESDEEDEDEFDGFRFRV
ncbi:hypothetical protein GGR57DRAFT_452119 [Xylariaceae sp. FL1272]|nr:hypothetical protein GGR57DRAFT_452119 [Xylariaceae sp. FL1272]